MIDQRGPVMEDAPPVTSYIDPVCVGLAVAGRSSRYAWGLAASDGQRLSGLTESGQGSTDALLDGLAALLAHPTLPRMPLDLYWNDSRLHEGLEGMRTAFPSIEPHLCRGPGRRNTWIRQALEVAEEALDEAGVPLPQPSAPTVMIAATDGSFGRRSREGGWGWVSACGRWGFGSVRCSHPTAAEVAAIARLVSTVPKSRPLHILTDSKAAIALIGQVREAFTDGREAHSLTGHHDTDQLLVAIGRRLATGHFLELGWVRGHSGHPLNEGADRLAVLGRRAAHAGLPRELSARTAKRIADETLDALRTASVPLPHCRQPLPAENPVAAA
ncbi:RNase H family protein [Allostreptomyces psammosilenae]|uniref:Ribonuclease HI n=1 Tax=Allostreptomyces psammosilenae TaxID=1892865 RepID=A0A852ZRB9_9ACTN|nr:RNase H family protein [Allostreptomyces psammosilenae]NYI04943.1 ribonuclease HI [Allostreptomyces psammosilenae]